jgi:hypothetical protein
MVLDSELGRTDLAGPYRKPAGELGAHRGTVYTVCGCSGEGGPNSFFYGHHPAMAKSLSDFGSLLLRVDGLRLDLQFLRPSGAVDDYFTLDKSQPTSVRPELQWARQTGGATLSWPKSNPSYHLESIPALGSGGIWQPVTNVTGQIGRRNVVTLGFETPNRFFRVRQDP